MSAATATGAEILLKAASDQGIEVCFANPGTSEMHFVSALDSVHGVRPVLGLHETVCSGAADGYGRMKGKPALTLLHLGPGLANALTNLHNARRAGTPVVNLIGDMATWHKAADPILNMDIEALARTVSQRVITPKSGSASDLATAMTEACRTTEKLDRIGGSRVTTLIVPHDMSWERHPCTNAVHSTSASRFPLPMEALQFIKDCAKALTSCQGKKALYIGGRASIAENDALMNIGRIAAATGATLYSENAFARLDRGAGLPAIQRLPYFPQDAARTLSEFEQLVLIDVRRPVANFGYEKGPSQLITKQSDEQIWEMDSADIDIVAALQALALEVGADKITPFVNCRGSFVSPSRPTLPSGKLSPTSMCQVVAALQPEGAIIIDESLTSGNAYWEASKGCPQFSHLCLTGGAIGCGPPLSVGAAVACADRVVINLQADGSCMYSLQALWTQARENLKVITIICANKTYAILKVEMAKQRISPSSGPAARALTELGKPALNWVALAAGMGVHATRVSTSEELKREFLAALERQGPSLIEAEL